MEDVVEGQGQLRCKEHLLDLCSGLLQVLSALLDVPDLVVVQYEGRNIRAAHEVSVCIITHHERAMVDNGTSSKPLNDEVLVVSATIVLDGHLNDSLLDQEQFVGFFTFFADKTALLVGSSLHSVNDLLLSL